MGYVYFIQDTCTKLVKIGRARDVKQRLHDLQVAAPCKLVLLAAARVGDDIAAEYAMHKRYAAVRVRGEWFRLNDEPGILSDELERSHPFVETLGRASNERERKSALALKWASAIARTGGHAAQRDERVSRAPVRAMQKSEKALRPPEDDAWMDSIDFDDLFKNSSPLSENVANSRSSFRLERNWKKNALYWRRRGGSPSTRRPKLFYIGRLVASLPRGADASAAKPSPDSPTRAIERHYQSKVV